MNKLIFDIGATNTKFALMSNEGEILAREKFRTDYSSVENYYASIASIALKYRDGADGIAISTNGRMDPAGEVYQAWTMKSLTGTSPRQETEKRVGLPVCVINDGSAAALGEFCRGAGRGVRNMMGIVLGSGMGGGLILDGKLYTGARNNAAMVFGMVNSFEPGCPDVAGVSTAFSLLLYKLAAVKQLPPETVTGEKFFDLYEDGDEAARQLLSGYCRSVAMTVWNSAMLMDFDTIVVTGGLAARDVIIDGINNSLKEIVSSFTGSPEVGMLLNYTNADPRAFDISVKKGELLLDANLFGALHYLLS